MNLVDNMQLLSSDMINSQKERIANLQKLREQVAALLALYEQQRETMSAELATMLKEDRLRRLTEVEELLQSYHQELLAAHRVWVQTLETLAKIRRGLIDP